MAPIPPAFPPSSPAPISWRAANIWRGRPIARLPYRAGRQAFAGGLPFKLPFGTLYSPNITPDKETGIGAWSDEEFSEALHKGVGRDGQHLYPGFSLRLLRPA